MMRIRPLLCVALLSAAGCGADAPPADTEVSMAPAPLNLEAVGQVLLERLDLRPGEKLLLVSRPGRFDALVPLLRAGAVAAGAVDLGSWAVEGQAPASWNTDFTESLEGLEGDALAEALAVVDAAVMMPGAGTQHSVYAALQEVLRSGHGRTVHFHWAGAYALDGTLMEMNPVRDAFYQNVLTSTDYAGLSVSQSAFEASMRGSTVRVTTPGGTDLSFRIGDRPVTRQDGDASARRATSARNLIDREVELPAGAIRVAPVEGTVQGRIVFPPSVWSGQRVEGLTLDFSDGVVTGVRAASGEEAALAEMDGVGAAGRAFREFALGFNPLLAIPTDDPWIPYYGYGAGVVRLSLGDNTELGGAVGGGYVRWNFFPDATVTVDGVPWVVDGRLTPPGQGGT